jgi:putative glutamate/gamma-aminobutyrate antiporter
VKTKKDLGIFVFVMMNIATVMSLKGLPLIASTGSAMLFYLLFSTIFFLVPCAFVAAELSTSWSKPGGVYLWVKSALGDRFGVFAVCMQWIQNVICAPTVLSFASDSLAYSFGAKHLANSGVYTALMTIFIYWCAIFITLSGLKLSGIITTVGSIIGTIIPGLLLIVLGIAWLDSGSTINITITANDIFPDFTHFGNISFAASIMILFSGMEVNAVHVNDLKNPTSDYLKSIVLSVIIILGVFSLGAMSVGIILPQNSISLTYGIMQALEMCLIKYNLLWVVKVFAICIALGVVAWLIAWICGPSRGVLVAAENNELPKFFAYKNKAGVQRNILMIQGLLVTILSSLNFFINNVNEVYFLCTEMAMILYLIMYFLMFISALRLRYTMRHIKRRYKVPGGSIGMWIICGTGLTSVIFAFVFAFFPPTDLGIASTTDYVSIIVSGVVVVVLASILLYRKPSSPKKV